jgi:DNA-binding GntR family transcriptional regulator
MELIAVDTQEAYTRIREAIVTLALNPGSLLDEQKLADALHLGGTPVREALKLLVHDGLVILTPRHGLYVADISLADLEQISEVRQVLEPFCAELAAQRATPDDLSVLEALRNEHAAISGDDRRRLLDVDHKFHQAVVRAAANGHLVRVMEHLFGLSQRLWYLALPQLDMLPSAVAEHLELLTAIQRRDAERARRIMHAHVKDFYDRVRSLLETSPPPHGDRMP